MSHCPSAKQKYQTASYVINPAARIYRTHGRLAETKNLRVQNLHYKKENRSLLYLVLRRPISLCSEKHSADL